MTVEPVHIAASDPSWPSLFAEERARVLGAAGRWIEEVEHIGSTAVPGLDAKPVVDLMAGLGSMDDADACVGPLVRLGYSYWAEGAEPHHRLFVRFVDPGMSARTHNLHLVEAGGRYWRERLLFRDHLREHPETAAAYVRLKLGLAERHRDDREATRRLSLASSPRSCAAPATRPDAPSSPASLNGTRLCYSGRFFLPVICTLALRG